ncbi:hypothetical protein HK098_006485 [Nowakowskiella sp. JEL0407]|nr:hypothetical protein HK098_006485 [Nowakowskiella sp. JEL0407]
MQLSEANTRLEKAKEETAAAKKDLEKQRQMYETMITQKTQEANRLIEYQKSLQKTQIKVKLPEAQIAKTTNPFLPAATPLTKSVNPLLPATLAKPVKPTQVKPLTLNTTQVESNTIGAKIVDRLIASSQIASNTSQNSNSATSVNSTSASRNGKASSEKILGDDFGLFVPPKTSRSLKLSSMRIKPGDGMGSTLRAAVLPLKKPGITQRPLSLATMQSKPYDRKIGGVKQGIISKLKQNVN